MSALEHGAAADTFDDERARLRSLTLQLIEQHPFWGYLLLQVKVELDPTLPFIAVTDCLHTITFNPRLTRPLSRSELGFALVHELGHQVYASLPRQRGRDPYRWNQATDYAINRIVAEIPHPSGKGPMYTPIAGILLDRRFDGLIAEAIYERLVAEGAGAGEGVPELLVRGQRVTDHRGGIDGHLPASAAAEGELLEELGARVRAAAAHHEERNGQGHAPAGLLRILGEATPKIPWGRLFRRFAQAALDRDELDPRRPNRRWLSEGFVVPGRSSERVGLVIVALDTSGSMGPVALAEAAAELRALSAEVADLRLVVADAKVQETVTLEGLPAWLRRRKARGGGGTDHRPVFRWIEAERNPPDLFIGITDLHTTLPSRPPPYPVLWLCPKRHGRAPWGRVIATA
jgi:predicted metal-dependent peptidase